MDTSNTFVTYRRSDGKLIWGEFTFMTDYLDVADEECDIIEERWVLESRKVIPYVDPYEDYEDFEEFEPVTKNGSRENDVSGSLSQKN